MRRGDDRDVELSVRAGSGRGGGHRRNELMKALMKLGPGPGNWEVGTAVEPSCGAKEIVIAVSGCGICGSDLTVYHEGALHEVDAPFPRIMGHEFTGEVVEVGTDVEDFAVGDWVIVNPHEYCGSCLACRRSEQEMCANLLIYGVHKPGAFAERIGVRAQNALRLPREVALAVGALAEPLACGVHTVERLHVQGDDLVVVLGPGPIGVLIAIAAQEAGVARLLVTGLEDDRERLTLAESLGIETHVSRSGSLERRGAELSDGVGADVVFEAAGSPTAVGAALQLCRTGGRVGALGLPHEPIVIEDPYDLVLSEKSIIGVRSYRPASWVTTVAILERRVDDLRKVISHRMPIEAWHEAIELLERRAAMKVVLAP